jgi:pimeloyl-ACP methyl ester carboxylesterase
VRRKGKPSEYFHVLLFFRAFDDFNVSDLETFILPGGRTLAYATEGPVDGVPLLALHGLPGSRLQRHPDRHLSTAEGVRLITVDRPGYGLSSPQRRRSLLSFADDCLALLKHLGIGQCYLSGISGGVPYALAIAHRAPGRVIRLCLISGVAPPAWLRTHHEGGSMLRLGYFLGRHAPWVMTPFRAYYVRRLRQEPDLHIRNLVQRMGPADAEILLSPEVSKLLIDDHQEALRQSHHQMGQDLTLYARDWGFALAGIRCETRLWHGEADQLVPASASRWMATQIPRAHLTLLPEAGHFFAFRDWPIILRTLIQP